VIHTDVVPNGIQLSKSITNSSKIYLKACLSVIPKPFPTPTPPPRDIIKIKFDTTIRDFFSALAATSSNSYGSILFAHATSGPPCEPSVVEALAAHLAVKLAIDHDRQNILLGDSLTVVLSFQHSYLTSYWKIAPIISYTFGLLSSIRNLVNYQDRLELGHLRLQLSSLGRYHLIFWQHSQHRVFLL
jgi:hypothetical protein